MIDRRAPILKPGRTCWSIEPATTGVLIDGEDYYRAFHEAVAQAKGYVLIGGWQFDSAVRLRRGRDAGGHGDVRFLPFLQRLCDERPDLRVHILAWEHSVFYAREREWLQELVFAATNERIVFRLDGRHPLAGCHHYKLVIVDGAIAFSGGMDVCADRWDERRHAAVNPERVDPYGKAYGPYHDIQSVVSGGAVERLEEFFRTRWRLAGGGELELPRVRRSPIRVRPTIPIRARHVAIARTTGASLFPLSRSVREIERLYADAIVSAERLVYVENQYVSSRAVCEALVGRMREPGRSKLDVVLVMPPHPEKSLEDLAVGATQADVLRTLRETARATGHRLGIFCTAPPGTPRSCSTYVHSKVLVVDDRFLTIGSANATNRSMGLDTELNLAWEAHGADAETTARSIRRVRVSLLAEHTGATSLADLRALARADALVATLDDMAGRDGARIFPTAVAAPTEIALFRALTADIADAEEPIFGEDLVDKLLEEKDTLLARGLAVLSALFLDDEDRAA